MIGTVMHVGPGVLLVYSFTFPHFEPFPLQGVFATLYEGRKTCDYFPLIQKEEDVPCLIALVLPLQV